MRHHEFYHLLSPTQVERKVYSQREYMVILNIKADTSYLSEPKRRYAGQLTDSSILM